MCAARRRRHRASNPTTAPPVTEGAPTPPTVEGAATTQPVGNLTLMRTVASWCGASLDAILEMCDWYVQRPDDGGVLGFKACEGAKILAVAHLDYVGSGKISELDEHHIVSSALDDRLGACLAYNLQAYIGVPADVVFCDKEEIGCSTLPLLGTKMLAKYNWIIELDRRGEGAVCYQYKVMESYIQKHFELHQGTFSDICTICHTSPVGAFNMAVGYDLEHTAKCNATVERITRQMNRLKAFYAEFGDTKILHTPPAKTAWQNRQRFEDDDWNNYVMGTVLPVVQPKKTTVEYEDEPLNRAHCSTQEIIELTKKGWHWNTRHHVFCRFHNPALVLTMADEILYESEYYELLDEIDANRTGVELAQQYADGELTQEDLEDYETLGWRRDPDTGDFYQIEDDGDDQAVVQ